MNIRKRNDLSALAPRVIFRTPIKEDGIRIRSLACASPPLVANSLSTTVMHCVHFGNTSIVAEIDGSLAGFTLAYRLPQSPDTIFILQTAVATPYRRLGLAEGMITALLNRKLLADITRLESRMTPHNVLARKVFEKIAARFDTCMEVNDWIDSSRHFLGQQPDELKVSLGPMAARRPTGDTTKVLQTSDAFEPPALRERF